MTLLEALEHMHKSEVYYDIVGEPDCRRMLVDGMCSLKDLEAIGVIAKTEGVK